MKQKVRKVWYRRRVSGVGAVIGVLACFFLMNWLMLSRIPDSGLRLKYKFVRAISSKISVPGELRKLVEGKRPEKTIYARLLAMATHTLAEGQNKPEPKDLWEEPFVPASSWRPCADQRNWEPSEGNNGYILVSANGGINQQRVAVCNAVAVTRLLNATLVVPKFLYSSVWRDVRRSILSTT